MYLNDNLEQVEATKTDQTDSNVNGADIDEIDYRVFTNSAKIEIHGCNSANKDYQNLAGGLSKKLYAAGKTKAVVIGHVDFANPNGTKNRSDYRSGVRRVYHNGTALFTTKKTGRITKTTIDKYIKLKNEQGEKYDGSTQVY